MSDLAIGKAVQCHDNGIRFNLNFESQISITEHLRTCPTWLMSKTHSQLIGMVQLNLYAGESPRFQAPHGY